MKTNKAGKNKKYLKDIVLTTFAYLESGNPYITKEVSNATGKKSTASEIFSMLNNGTVFKKQVFTLWEQYVDYNTFGSPRKSTILDNKHRIIIKNILDSKSKEVDGEHFGTVVYSVYRFLCREKLKEISAPYKNSKFMPVSIGSVDNFFIKITHKMEFNKAFYFRWVDPNSNIGAFFMPTNEKTVKIEIGNCLGIRSKVKQFKYNIHTGIEETIFSEVEVLHNYGSK